MHELFPSWVYIPKCDFYADKPGWCLCSVIWRASKVPTAWNICTNDMPEIRDIRVTFRIKILSVEGSKFYFNNEIMILRSVRSVCLIRGLGNGLVHLTNLSFGQLFWDWLNYHHWLCVPRAFDSKDQQKTPNVILCHFGYFYELRTSQSLLPLFRSLVSYCWASVSVIVLHTAQMILTLSWCIPACSPFLLACHGGPSMLWSELL